MSDNKLKRVLCLFLAMLFIFFELSSAVLAVSESDIKVNNIKNNTNTVEEKIDKGKEVLEEDKEKEEAKSKIESLKKALEEKFKAEKEIEEVQVESESGKFKNKKEIQVENESDKLKHIEETVHDKTVDIDEHLKDRNSDNKLNNTGENFENEINLTPENSIIEEPKRLTTEEYQNLKKTVKTEYDLSEENILDNDTLVDEEKSTVVSLQDDISNQDIQKDEKIVDIAYSEVNKHIINNSLETSVNKLDNLINSNREAINKEMTNSDNLEISDQLNTNQLTASGQDPINKFTVTWLNGNEDDPSSVKKLDWIENSNDLRARLYYGLKSDSDTFKPGTLEIKIPKQVFRDRNGKPIGNITLGVPRYPNNMQPIAYIESEEYITFVNVQELPKSTVGFIEFTYKAPNPEIVKDLKTGYKTDELKAIMKLNYNDQEYSREYQNNLFAQVDTMAKITNTSGKEGYPYETYPDIFPTELEPKTNVGGYVYTDNTAYISHKATQPFKLKVKSEATSHNGKILGIRISNGNKIIQNTNLTNSQEIELDVSGGFVSSQDRGFYVTTYSAYPVSEFSESKQYNLDVKTTYTMTATDDGTVTSKDITLTVPYTPIRFNAPNNHFGTVKYGDGINKKWNGYKYYGIYDYALNQLNSGQDVDITYKTYLIAWALPFTYPNFTGSNKEDSLDAYRKGSFIATMEDNISEDDVMNDDDYELKSITFLENEIYDYIPYSTSEYGYAEENGKIQYRYLPVGNYGYKKVSSIEKLGIKDKSNNVEIYALDSQNNKTKVASGNITENDFQLTTENGSAYSKNTLTFPSGTKSYKLVFKSGFPGYRFTIKPTVTIKSTDNIKQIASQSLDKETPLYRIGFISKAEGKGKHSSFSSVPDYGYDHLMGAMQGYRLTKELNYINDAENSRVVLNYTLNADNQTNITDPELLKDAISKGIIKEEKSGTWYDLLPKGVDIDINSISANNGDSIEDVKVERNYKSSGRDLLIVKTKHNPNYQMKFGDTTWRKSILGIDGLCDTPSISYKAYYTWMLMRNYAHISEGSIKFIIDSDSSYKSGNEGDIGISKGYLGENSSADSKRNKYTPKDISDFIKNPNGKDITNSYLFEKHSKEITVDKSAITGVFKYVDVNAEGSFTTGINRSVYSSGFYKYRISLTNDDKNTTKGIVFYDKLDNNKIINNKEIENTWKGKLQSLDLSQLESEGIKPTIYYSTKETVNLNPTDGSKTSDMDLNNTEIWTRKMPSDKSTITAIAVDATKTTDSKEYELGKGKSLYIDINMKAPDYEGNENKLASNRASIQYLQNTDGVEEKEVAQNSQPTQIGIKPFYLQVTNHWQDDNNRDGIRKDDSTSKLELIKNGKPTGRIIELNADNKWTKVINDLEYQDENGTPINYTFKQTNTLKDYEFRPGVAKKVETKDSIGLVFDVVNYHDPYRINITGEKKWRSNFTDGKLTFESKLNRPRDITVILKANDKNISSTRVVPAKDDTWKYQFNNVYKNENGKPIDYKVEEKGYIEGYKPAEYKNQDIINTYYPFGDVRLIKKSDNATKQATEKEFEFKVEIYDKNNSIDPNTYKYEYESGNGKISTGGIVKLKATNEKSGELVLKDIPVSSKVVITELKRDGFTTDKAEKSNIVKSGREEIIEYTNHYSSTGKVILQGEKVLKGQKMQGYKFLFDLYNSEGKIIQTVRNDSKGRIYFDPIIYTDKDLNLVDGKGELKYTIKERQEKLKGYKYDGGEVKVTVSLQDNGDGTITATPKYETKDNSMKFTNEYEAKGNLNISFIKSIKYSNSEIKSDEFEFTLYKLKDGKEIKVVTSKNIGNSVEFKKADYYTQDDIGKTFEYVIKETKSDDKIYKPNSEYLKFKDEITDNDDGTLSVSTLYEGRFDEKGKKINEANNNIPEFINTRQDGSLTVRKLVENANKTPEKKFKFKITFTGDKEIIPKELKGQVVEYKNSQPTTISSLKDNKDLKLYKSELIEDKLEVSPETMNLNSVGSGNEKGEFIKKACPEGTYFECKTQNNELDMGYIDKSNINTTNLDLTNDPYGMTFRYHSNNGETKSFTKNYPALNKKDLTDTDVFPDNEGKWAKSGFVFKGWSKNKDSSEPDYMPGKKIKESKLYPDNGFNDTDSETEQNLYAIWKIPNYTITFNPNDGKGSMSNANPEYGKEFTLPENLFFKPGYKFKGWSESKDGSIKYKDKGSINKSESNLTNGSLTLYAVWEVDNLNLSSTNGEFSIELRQNEEITFNNLPAGLKYQVEEVLDPKTDTTDEKWSIIKEQDTSGIIEPGNTNKPAITTNIYNIPTVNYNLEGTKKIDGKASSLDGFKFKLEPVSENSKDIIGIDDIIVSAVNSTGKFTFPLNFKSEGEYKFKVNEVKLDENSKYTSDDKVWNVTLKVTNNSGKLEVKYVENTPIVFNNTIKTHKLKVTKDSANNFGLNPEFEFIVYEDGTIKGNSFKLKNGEFKEVDIKEGSNYKIVEKTTDNWKQEPNSELEGTINKDDKSVIVKNSYTPDYTENSNKFILNAKKVLNGRKLKDKEFEFKLTSDDNNELNYYTTNDKDGNIIFNNIPLSAMKSKGNKFTLSEVNTGENNLIYSNKEYKIEFDLKQNRTYVSSPETIKVDGQDVNISSSEDTLIFENKLKFRDLNIQKVIENYNDKMVNDEFEVEVKYKNPDYVKPEDGKKSNIEEYITNTLTLKHNETGSVAVPVGYEYYITEKVGQNSKYSLQSITNESQIMPDNNVDVIVTNKYKDDSEIKDNTPGTIINITAQKNVLDSDGKDSDDSGNKYINNHQFNFTLMDEKFNVIGSAVNDQDGSITFKPIQLNPKDIKDKLNSNNKTFKYYIKESSIGDLFIKYDNTIYLVEVTFKEENGQIAGPEIKYYKTDNNGNPIGEALNQAEFNNKYQIIDHPITGYQKSIITISIISGILGIAILVSRRKKINKDKIGD